MPVIDKSKYNWGRPDRFRSRLNALARVFTKTDRILTGRREVGVTMAVSSANGVPAPGFSDGTNIVINHDRIPDVQKAVGLVRLSAVNYHELAHVMFTPRVPSFRQHIVNNGLQLAFNILEDQRIETLFVAKYRPAAKYFTEMNAQLFLVNPKAHSTSFLFTYGRRYLPLEIRETLEEAFIGDNIAKTRAKRLIDEYRVNPMTVDSDLTRALVIIEEFNKILTGLKDDGHQVISKGNPDGTGTCTNNEHTDNGASASQPRVATRKEMEDAAERAKQDTAEQDEAEENGEDGSGFWEDVDPETDDDTDESEDDGDDEDSEGGGDGSDSSDSDDDDEDWDSGDGDDGYDEDGEADDDDFSGSSSGRGNSGDDDGDEDDVDGDYGDRGDTSPAGGGSGHGLTDLEGEIREIISEILDAIHESADVQNDIRTIRAAMSEAALELDSQSAKGAMRPCSAEEQMTATKIETEFRRLYAQLEPGWKYGSDHGRLNVQRAIESASSPFFDNDELFDEWDEGREDEAGVEAFISVDLSGSMGSNEDKVSSVLWMLKKALDSIDASVSVAGFHESTFTLYQRTERVHPSQVAVFAADGGDTAPGDSFRMARRIMSQTEHPNRLFVVITDGQWSTTMTDDGFDDEGVSRNEYAPGMSTSYANFPALLDEIDATKVFIGIGNPYYNRNYGGLCAYPDQFDHVFDITDVAVIAEKIRIVVQQMLAKVVAGRR